MRKMKVVMSLLLIVLAGITVAYAVSSYNMNIVVVIPNSTPELALTLMELTRPDQDPWEGTKVENYTMNFGGLSHLLATGAEAGVWYSQKYYCVFAFPTSFGKQYEIKSTCEGLTDTSISKSLPTGSFLLTPNYSEKDKWAVTDPQGQGAQPSGSTLGTAGSAITTNKSIYQSEAAAANRILRAFYSIPNASSATGFTPVPLSQAPGTYAGKVTITIVTL